MNLSSYLDKSVGLGQAIPAQNFKETRDAITAISIVKASDLNLDWGASYTWPTGYKKIGTTVAATGSEAVTGKNIVDVLRSLALTSAAWFFPHGTVRGSKARGVPTKQQEVYGILPVAKDTGVITELFEMRIAGMHLYQEYFNQLRVASTDYHVFVFLNNMCIWVRPEHTPVFHDMGVAIGGDAANSVTGGDLQLSCQSVGEIVWKDNVPFAHMGQSNFQFTWAAAVPTTLTQVTCTTGSLKFTGTASAGGSWTRPINEAAYSTCVVYSLEILEGPGTTGFTIDSATGTVTVATGLTAGTYKVRVIAQNNTSVFGVYDAYVTLT